MGDVIKNRYEFVVLFDVENGNPNGDPDAGNMPRIDPESGLGLVTDVCIKRKIRNYVETVKEDEKGYGIYIKEDVPLNKSDRNACKSLGVEETEDKKLTEELKKLKKSDPDVDKKLRDYMCENFYDIRTFGAVMTTFVKASLNCGQVRGPVQLGFARSIDPIISQEVTITRVAITTEKDAENKSTEMGRKSIVPYGLYRLEGYISANLARKVTGFSEEDLELLWDAIINMFENDHSAARGKMAVRELIIFKHSKELGDCPAYKLFDSVEVKKIDGVEYPRRYQSTEMGRKSIVPYGLYRLEGYISANLARKVTGFSEEDLELLWDAIINMFENDHSAARGKMAVRELIIFKHSKELGDCPAYKLFDSVEVKKIDGVEYPRRYQDYIVEIHNDNIPDSVEVKRMV